MGSLSSRPRIYVLASGEYSQSRSDGRLAALFGAGFAQPDAACSLAVLIIGPGG